MTFSGLWVHKVGRRIDRQFNLGWSLPVAQPSIPRPNGMRWEISSEITSHYIDATYILTQLPTILLKCRIYANQVYYQLATTLATTRERTVYSDKNIQIDSQSSIICFEMACRQGYYYALLLDAKSCSLGFHEGKMLATYSQNPESRTMDIRSHDRQSSQNSERESHEIQRSDMAATLQVVFETLGLGLIASSIFSVADMASPRSQKYP